MEMMKQLKRFAIAAMMALPMVLLASCSEVSSKLGKAADAVDSGNYTEAQTLADEVLSKHWSDMDIYDKCDLAAVYFVLFGEYDDTNYDKLRRCWDSAMSEDRATATDYINSQLEGGVETIEATFELYEAVDDLEEVLSDDDYYYDY